MGRVGFLFGTLWALAACGASSDEPVMRDGVELGTEAEDAYSVAERFDAAYLGDWSESGVCADEADAWQLTEDTVRMGTIDCEIDRLSRGTPKIQVALANCTASEAPDVVVFDISGEDVLYAEYGEERLRLERCLN